MIERQTDFVLEFWEEVYFEDSDEEGIPRHGIRAESCNYYVGRALVKSEYWTLLSISIGKLDL